MSLLFPRFVQSEFAPVFRLLDGAHGQSYRSFQPRFDVQETKDGYKLEGEFPGFDQKDINIEFDERANTLSIKDRSERHSEERSRPIAQAEAPAEAPRAVESDTNSYHKASVEEDNDAFVDVAKEDATPATTPAESTTAATETQEVAQEPRATSKYWISERSVGQFSRTFTFPKSVGIDQEHVKASLKNGILSVVVPKAELPPHKHIEIQ